METFLVPFDYDVHLGGRYGGAGKAALRRDIAAIEIPTVRMADVPVAYRIAHRRDFGPGRHFVLRSGGQLWWPLVDRMLGFHTKYARDFLRELRDGRSDLFVRRCLDDHHLQDHRRSRIVHDDHDDTLTAVRRSARSLLVVDDRLYAAGGVPLLVEASWGVCIAGTGANRAVPAPAGDLRIKAANGHRGDIDLEICRGYFFLPDSSDLADAKRRRPFGFRGPRIETIDGDAIDALETRIDAAFRTAWSAMNKSIPRTRPEGFARLRAQFLEACGPSGGDSLTAARYFALYDFANLFGQAERKPVAVEDCLDGVRRTLNLAASRFLHLSPQDLSPSLTAVEDAALGWLAGEAALGSG